MTYLYNGVELPDINTVWTDKETYPYAVVFKSIAYGFYMLVASNSVFTTYIHSSLNNRVFSSGKCNWSRYTNESDPVQWAFSKSLVNDSLNYFVDSYSPVWANFDMIDTDTSAVYLAASEPVPVGVDENAPIIDMKSWLTGFVLGLCGKPLPFAEEIVLSFEKLYTSFDPYTAQMDILAEYTNGADHLCSDPAIGDNYPGTATLKGNHLELTVDVKTTEVEA